MNNRIILFVFFTALTPILTLIFPSLDITQSAYASEATPSTTPSNFENIKGTPAKRNKYTGEIWVLDRLHKDHWEVYKNKKDYDKGKRNRAVWNDGRLKRKF